MYAMHICNLSSTSMLQDIVLIHAWSGHKPNISHLCIFSLIIYANIPKGIYGGKLEVMLVKCCLLRWWAEKTKGYWLKECETRKLVIAWNVWFTKNTLSNDLVIIDGDEGSQQAIYLINMSEKEVNEGSMAIDDNIENLSALPPPSLLTSKESSDFKAKGWFKPEENPTSTQPHALRWSTLPLQKLSC